ALARYFWPEVLGEVGGDLGAVTARVRAARGPAANGKHTGTAAGGSPFVFTWDPVDSRTLAETDYRPHWLAEQALVARQPRVVAAPQKPLKTSTFVDLAISLASGTAWLGHFRCPARTRVAILSGESGPYALQQTAPRVCAARGLTLADLGDGLCWLFRLPQLA